MTSTWWPVRGAYEHLQLASWLMGHRRGGAPSLLKRRTIRDYARHFGIEILVETGTYRGDTIWAARRWFREIHSVELQPDLYRRAVDRFAPYQHVHLNKGDSGVVLPGVVSALTGPALFWLDGHWSGGVTARGEVDSPVRIELRTVLGDTRFPHVVLMDDARLFTGEADYPSLDEIRTMVRSRPELTVRIHNDIIRVAPRLPSDCSSGSRVCTRREKPPRVPH
jgi:hypothetical protein